MGKLVDVVQKPSIGSWPRQMRFGGARSFDEIH